MTRANYINNISSLPRVTSHTRGAVRTKGQMPQYMHRAKINHRHASVKQVFARIIIDLYICNAFAYFWSNEWLTQIEAGIEGDSEPTNVFLISLEFHQIPHKNHHYYLGR